MNKKTQVIIGLVTILILTVIIVTLATIEESSSPRLIEKETSLLEIKQCKIDLYPDAEITLNINETFTLNANNYQGNLKDISWTSKNPMVASFNTHLGDKVNLIAYNKGRTEIIVTDRSIGDDCTDYLFVNVR